MREDRGETLMPPGDDLIGLAVDHHAGLGHGRAGRQQSPSLDLHDAEPALLGRRKIGVEAQGGNVQIVGVRGTDDQRRHHLALETARNLERSVVGQGARGRDELQHLEQAGLDDVLKKIRWTVFYM